MSFKKVYMKNWNIRKLMFHLGKNMFSPSIQMAFLEREISKVEVNKHMLKSKIKL